MQILGEGKTPSVTGPSALSCLVRIHYGNLYELKVNVCYAEKYESNIITALLFSCIKIDRSC
jgi:hypothetical protein